MSEGRPHKNLDVWHVSMDFVEEVYEKTGSFPDSEKYGLTSQLRRASVSIPSNISEGAGRQSKEEFARYLRIASGSISEVDTLLQISRRLELMSDGDYEELMSFVKRISSMLSGLLSKLDT
jgi:four helix bundle protein